MDHARGARGDSRIAGEGEGVGEGMNVWRRKQTRMKPKEFLFRIHHTSFFSWRPFWSPRPVGDLSSQGIKLDHELKTDPLPLNLGTETQRRSNSGRSRLRPGEANLRVVPNV